MRLQDSFLALLVYSVYRVNSINIIVTVRYYFIFTGWTALLGLLDG